MGLDMWEACAAEARVGAGFGVGAAGEEGARYFIIAGSTSGVP